MARAAGCVVRECRARAITWGRNVSEGLWDCTASEHFGWSGAIWHDGPDCIIPARWSTKIWVASPHSRGGYPPASHIFTFHLACNGSIPGDPSVSFKIHGSKEACSHHLGDHC